MKKFLFILFLLIVLAAVYMAGEKGPNPILWFATPTFTPTTTFTPTETVTPTLTPSITPTSTPTFTSTPTPIPTPTPAPVHKKKKTAKKHVTAPPPKKPAPPPPPVAPEAKPICNAPSLSTVVAESGTNNTFATAQNLGALESPGLQVQGSLRQLANVTDPAQVQAYKIDPKTATTDLDVGVYSFSSTTAFMVVLDCYSGIIGKPNPIYEQDNYRLEVYNELFELVAISYDNDPIQAVETSSPGQVFYAVVYGMFGKPGNYKLTITPKDTK